MKNTILSSDYSRYEKINNYLRKFLKYFRKSQTSSGFLSKFYRFKFHRLSYSHGIEMSSSTSIGEGFYIGHPFNIRINRDVVIGKNFNIHAGVTIGQENRGTRKGSPTIGNNVWVGVNSTIVGKITIGDNVLIAPNSFVNEDIPSNSIVFGNPCVVKKSNYATKDYINRGVSL